jgi:hypothetical protein
LEIAFEEVLDVVCELEGFGSLIDNVFSCLGCSGDFWDCLQPRGCLISFCGEGLDAGILYEWLSQFSG